MLKVIVMDEAGRMDRYSVDTIIAIQASEKEIKVRIHGNNNLDAFDFEKSLYFAVQKDKIDRLEENLI
jgi:hypothetical protein